MIYHSLQSSLLKCICIHLCAAPNGTRISTSQKKSQATQTVAISTCAMTVPGVQGLLGQPFRCSWMWINRYVREILGQLTPRKIQKQLQQKGAGRQGIGKVYVYMCSGMNPHIIQVFSWRSYFPSEYWDREFHQENGIFTSSITPLTWDYSPVFMGYLLRMG